MFKKLKPSAALRGKRLSGGPLGVSRGLRPIRK
jgi:hypothetical protein